MSVESVWHEIDTLLLAKAPAIYGLLGGPATEGALAEAEADLGLRLPDELRRSLAIHDGEAQECWMMSTWSLLNLQAIVTTCREERSRRSGQAVVEADRFTQAVVWSDRWVPFAYDGSGGYLVVDLEPSIDGLVGQVTRTAHDSGNMRIASSLEEFLGRYARALESGAFTCQGDTVEVRSGFSSWWCESVKS